MREGLVEGMAEDKENPRLLLRRYRGRGWENESDGAPASDLDGAGIWGERLSVERFDLTELIASVISSSGVLLKQNELTVDLTEGTGLSHGAMNLK